MMVYYRPSNQFFFPNSFVRGPLLASKNNHESSHPFSFRPNSPQLARASSFTRLLDHTRRRTTIGRIPLGEWLARRRDLYVTTQHSRQTSMPLEVFETTTWAGQRPQTYALDEMTTGTGPHILAHVKMSGWQVLKSQTYISELLVDRYEYTYQQHK